MGWTGYGTEISTGVIFRKMYCHKCGAQLKKEKTTNIYKKGEPGFDNYIGHVRAIGMTQQSVTSLRYRCPNCASRISYDDQRIVAKTQKKLKMKIVTDEAISNTINNQLLTSIQKIKILSWFPVVGGWICLVCFDKILSEEIEEKGLRMLFYLPILTFFAVGLIAKFVLSVFNDVEIINNYYDMFILIPSLLSANIPSLWYINRTFKD